MRKRSYLKHTILLLIGLASMMACKKLSNSTPLPCDLPQYTLYIDDALIKGLSTSAFSPNTKGDSFKCEYNDANNVRMKFSFKGKGNPAPGTYNLKTSLSPADSSGKTIYLRFEEPSGNGTSLYYPVSGLLYVSNTDRFQDLLVCGASISSSSNSHQIRFHFRVIREK